jgi:hypothetical protein
VINMTHVFIRHAALLIGALSTMLALGATANAHANKPPKQFFAKLDGAAEVGVIGDPDGAGVVRVNVKQEAGKPAQICITADAVRIDTVKLVHLHNAPAGQNGPIVVNYPVNDKLVRVSRNGLRTRIKGCLEVDDALATALRENSANYYVNIHTEALPKGAIRGQLNGGYASPKHDATTAAESEAPAPAQTEHAHDYYNY